MILQLQQSYCTHHSCCLPRPVPADLPPVAGRRRSVLFHVYMFLFFMPRGERCMTHSCRATSMRSLYTRSAREQKLAGCEQMLSGHASKCFLGTSKINARLASEPRSWPRLLARHRFIWWRYDVRTGHRARARRQGDSAIGSGLIHLHHVDTPSQSNCRIHNCQVQPAQWPVTYVFAGGC